MERANSYIGSLVDESPDGFLVADASGCIEYISRRGVDLLGADVAGAVVGRGLDKFVVTEDRVRLADMLRHGSSGPTELRLERPTGEVVWIEANADRDDASDHEASVVILRDVTLRKRVETEILAAKAAVEEANRRLASALEDVERVAATDRLTGLWNRRHFERVAGAEIARCRRFGYVASLALFDIDHFKAVNDTHGHNVGDKVLAAVAAALTGAVRASDTPCRWGGEEFVVLAPSVSAKAAARFFDGVREAIARTDVGAPVGSVTVSVGVAQLAPGEELGDWLGRADEALYRAKRAGRNRVETSEAASDSPEHRLVQLVWDPSLECGDERTDDEHRQLFVMGNTLLDMAMTPHPPAVVAQCLDALLAHVTAHFRAEEEMLARVGYPARAAHARIHQALTDEALRLRARLQQGALGLDEVVRFLVVRVVHEHLLGTDTKFFPHVAAALARVN